jgi:N-acetylneuraminate synthase/sialic acid synthase
MSVMFNSAFRAGSRAFVIAEIGHNHQGSIDKAKAMFLAAKDAGADAVKLQKRDSASLFTRALYNQPYDNEHSFGATYGAHREALEFDRDAYLELQRYAAEIDVMFFATAFDFKSVEFLASLEMPAYKIASGDLHNTPLQREVARVGKPVILSTGGGTVADIRRACDAMLPINPQLCLLHCTASYPSEPEHMNLNAISTLLKEFPAQVIGLSDHENGIDAASVAYMLGARVFEKHFTINRAWKGTDHSFSLEPAGLKKLVRNLNRIPVLLGSAAKQPLDCEKSALRKMSKSIVAAADLPEGHVLTAADLALKSPGGGLPPYEYDNLLGRRLAVAVSQDDILTFEKLLAVVDKVFV